MAPDEEGADMENGPMSCDRHLFVIFGATGDLAHRKLLPSLYRIISEHDAAECSVLLGVSSAALSDTEFRHLVEQSLAAAGVSTDAVRAWCSRMSFHSVAHGAGLGDLRHRIERLETDHGLPGNRVLYLALPPAAFPGTIERLSAAGLNRSPGWTRLVVEKPFGRDLASAEVLNSLLHRHFDESAIYRIDHYLGKETVQNLLTFRFANPLFEHSWNRDRVAAVEITVAEDLGVGGRTGYYESAGVLRDMVQNHLTQLMTLVAMEAPSGFNARSVRNEKVQVLESIEAIDPSFVVYGRYTAGRIHGEPVAGYLDEEGVAPDSRTPTFVGVKLSIDSWRWQGVPFYLRTGKRLPRRTTQIAVTFKPAPICLFHGRRDDCLHPNVLLLTLQPDEGFQLRFEVKRPGSPPSVATRNFTFDYAAEFESIPDAYETLLFDVITGDQTLFVRGDEIESSWRLWTPILDLPDHPIYPYEAGTWGPAVTNEELRLWTDEWTMRG
jgi:glucose-6-phosphate 1-dehydrogenase